MEKSSREFNIGIGVEHLVVYPERCFDGESHFYYCSKNGAPREVLFTESLLEELSEEDLVELYESQNGLLH